jgi:Icc-related predicted phosphoesterase
MGNLRKTSKISEVYNAATSEDLDFIIIAGGISYVICVYGNSDSKSNCC